jgi:hypothetical protein
MIGTNLKPHNTTRHEYREWKHTVTKTNIINEGTISRDRRACVQVNAVSRAHIRYKGLILSLQDTISTNPQS